jgi:hypothetical protein
MQKTNEAPMRYVIRCLGFANGTYCPHLGLYLQSFTHEADNGRGFGKFTTHLRQALVFEDYDKALEFYLRPSKSNPIRPDGETNRPMTGMHAEFIPEQMWGEVTKREQMRYVSRIPRKMQPGLLCHNDERHTVDMPPRLNGFKAGGSVSRDEQLHAQLELAGPRFLPRTIMYRRGDVLAWLKQRTFGSTAEYARRLAR